jgi:hypothetical protein
MSVSWLFEAGENAGSRGHGMDKFHDLIQDDAFRKLLTRLTSPYKTLQGSLGACLG